MSNVNDPTTQEQGDATTYQRQRLKTLISSLERVVHRFADTFVEINQKVVMSTLVVGALVVLSAGLLILQKIASTMGWWISSDAFDMFLRGAFVEASFCFVVVMYFNINLRNSTLQCIYDGIKIMSEHNQAPEDKQP